MRVSAKSDYALRALIEIVNRSDGSPVSAEQLGKAQDIPHGFLQAILADLRRAGVVVSQRGQAGGWRLAIPGHRPSGWRCIGYGWSGSATSCFPGVRSAGPRTR